MAGNTVPIHGKVARTDKNGTLVEFTEGWDISVELDMDDISRQGQHWKESLPGQAGWSGNITAQLVTANTEQAALLANIVAAVPGTLLTDMKFMLEDASDYLAGDLYITGLAVPGAVGGKVTVTWPFTGNGVLALTTA